MHFPFPALLSCQAHYFALHKLFNHCFCFQRISGNFNFLTRLGVKTLTGVKLSGFPFALTKLQSPAHSVFLYQRFQSIAMAQCNEEVSIVCDTSYHHSVSLSNYPQQTQQRDWEKNYLYATIVVTSQSVMCSTDRQRSLKAPGSFSSNVLMLVFDQSQRTPC